MTMTKFFISAAIALSALSTTSIAAETELVVIVTPFVVKPAEDKVEPTRFGTSALRERAKRRRKKQAAPTLNKFIRQK